MYDHWACVMVDDSKTELECSEEELWERPDFSHRQGDFIWKTLYERQENI